jgi:DNA-binding transcriptional LysR family regulator
VGGRGDISVAELIELGRPFLRLRWWPSHHPELERIAAAMDSTLEIPMQAARHLTLQGAAVGFFPQLLIGEDIQRGALVEVAVRDLPPVERQSALVRRSKGGPPSAHARAFIDSVRQQAMALDLLPRAKARRRAGVGDR